jgi:hypothetical protein
MEELSTDDKESGQPRSEPECPEGKPSIEII